MKSIINQRKRKALATFANFLSVGGLLTLLASVILPYVMKGMELTSSILLIVGLFTAMIGIYFANRWVRRPRPENVLNEELKSLSDSHRLYHYEHPAADHLLLTPYGVTVIETVNLEGRFLYKGGRWQEFMKFGRALRYIVEEHLGDPIKAALSSKGQLERQLRKHVEGGDAVPVRAVVVFTHPRCALEIEETSIPVVKASHLKRAIVEKGEKMPLELYQRVQAYLDKG